MSSRDRVDKGLARRAKRTLDAEEARADRIGEVLESLADPEDERTVAQIAKTLGLSPSYVEHLRHRVQRRFVPLLRALEDIRTRDLSDLSKYNAWRLGSSIATMTDEELSKIPARDRAIAFGIFIDKHLLLEGRPTEILSVKELGALDDLAQVLVQEAKRRGIDLHVDPDTAEVTPSPRRQRILLSDGRYAEAGDEEKDLPLY